jgi:subtilisin family serine protease
MWPAAFCDVTAVGALDDATGARADFSNYGSWVDACGPGVGLVSTFFRYRGPIRATGGLKNFHGFASWSGTSFATPQFTGAVAALMSRSPGMPARVAAAYLLSSGRLVPGLGTEFHPHL